MAAGKLTLQEIAKQAGVALRTVSAWKKDADFQTEVRRLQNTWRAGVRGTGVADQEVRLRDRNDRYKRLRAVIQARAKDPQMKKAPGGTTGLLTVTYKMQSMGEGRGSAAVPEYSVDTGLLQEMREIEDAVAAELGQQATEPVSATATAQAVSIIERLHAGRERVRKAEEERKARDASVQ